MTLPVLETDRLILRQPEIADTDELVIVCGDLEVARWTSRVPHPYTRQDALDRIAAVRAAAESGEEYMYMAFDRTLAGHLVGLCGLSPDADGYSAEIGFLIGMRDWGKGYGNEIAAAVIDYGFEQLVLSEIVAAALPDNPRSIHLQEKLGFQYRENWVKDAPARGCSFDLEVRVLTRDNWSRDHGG